MKFESLLFACVIAILLCVLLVDGKAIHQEKASSQKKCTNKGKGDSQQAETQPIDTPDAGAAAGDADPTADAASNDDDAAMTPPAAADESDDQTENQQQNQLQNPLPVTGTVPPLQATTTPSPSLLAGAPPQPEAVQPEAAPPEDEAASGEGSGAPLPEVSDGSKPPGPAQADCAPPVPCAPPAPCPPPAPCAPPPPPPPPPPMPAPCAPPMQCAPPPPPPVGSMCPTYAVRPPTPTT